MSRVRISISEASHGRMVTLQLLNKSGIPETSLHAFPDIRCDMVGMTTVYSPLVQYGATVVFMKPDDAYRIAREILAPLDFARPQMRNAA